MSAKKILVVDDSSAIRHQVCSVLAAAGFEMLEAADGMEGADRVRNERDLALIICDVNMPRLDGLGMLESIQQEIAERKLPILMLTTEADPSSIERAKRGGARGWMVKPFKEHLLAAAATKLTATPS